MSRSDPGAGLSYDGQLLGVIRPPWVKTRHTMVEWLVSNEENAVLQKMEYYSMFKWLKTISAFILLSCFTAIAIAAIVHAVDGRVYVTLAPLKDNNPMGPPDAYTRFDIVTTARLFYFMFIPLIAGIFNLALILPRGAMWCDPWRLVRCLTYNINPVDSRKDFMQAYENAEIPSGKNEFGGTKTMDNDLFNEWFKYNLLYAGSGIKHGFYGMSASLFAVMVCELVGVTDFMQLIAAFIFTLLGYMQLWYLEYDYAYRNYDKHASSKLESGRDKSDDGIRMYKGWMTPSKSQISWISFSLAIFAILYPLIITATNLAFLESASDAKWYVWMAIITYWLHTLLILSVIAIHHADAGGNMNGAAGAFFMDYVMMEAFMIVLHAAVYSIIPMCVIFGARNTGFLYGIEIA